MMEIQGYIACICEGSAEHAIIELLLEKNKLIFDKDQLIEGEIIRSRDAKSFEKRYLNKGFLDKITIIRVLDSRKEKFNLSKAYLGKIEVVNIITAPEIEMLIVIKENKYKQFKSSKIKPSEFCKAKLKMKDVKRYEFIKAYFSDVEDLLKCIYEYRRLSKLKKGELTLWDLVK